MKTRLSVLALVTLASALLVSSSCAGVPKQVSITVPCADFEANPNLNKEVQVLEGGLVTVTLCSNATTGFQWEQEIYCPLIGTIITEKDHKFIPPADTAGLGAAGQEVWTFEAVNKGTATVAMVYSQPWEGGQKGAWTYNLVVTIK
jgi:inhibitor of cysteine peptidase